MFDTDTLRFQFESFEETFALMDAERELLNFEAEATAPADEQVWFDGERHFLAS
jgi:hypothetical protein